MTSTTAPATTAPATTAVRHPLEPLGPEEVQRAVALLREAGKVRPTTRFVSVALREPEKEVVRGFTGEAPAPRAAFAVLFDNATNACYEATVSLTDGALVSWVHVP